MEFRNSLRSAYRAVRDRAGPVAAELARRYTALPGAVQVAGVALAVALGVYFTTYVVLRLAPGGYYQRIEPYAGPVFAPAESFSSLFGLSRDQLKASGGEPVAVQGLRLVTEKIEPLISASGKIESLETVNIVSQNTGRIQTIFVDRGQRVERGAPLLQLERLPLELQLSQQRATLEQSSARLRLARERYENARRGVEVRWAQIEQRRIEAQRLRAELDRARTRFAGQETLYQEGGLSRDAYQAARTELIGREAAYLNARKEYEIASVGFRDEDLRARGLSAPSDPAARFRQFVDLNTRVEKAEAEAAAAEVSASDAAYRSTSRLLAETTIRSPIDGFVAERHRSAGEEVIGGGGMQSSEPILVLVNIRQVYVTMDIPESESVQLATGMEVRCTVDVFPDEVFTAEMKLISPVVQERSHTVEVRALIDNPEFRLKPGMFARGRIVTGPPRDAIMIPEDNLIPQGENKAVAFVVREGKAYRVEVELGQRLDGRYEIKAGLKAGDVIATEKFSILRDGLPVLVQLPRR